jgi:SAM-dependent methyltransferase
MSERVDFSGNAKVYDRRHGAVLAKDVVQRLAAAAAIRSGTSVLDIGAGTGRVAIGLAEHGCQMVALEPALGMVKMLRTKAGDLPIRLILKAWSEQRFDLGRSISMPREMCWTVYSKDAVSHGLQPTEAGAIMSRRG